MGLEFKKKYFIGITLGLIVIGTDIFFLLTNQFIRWFFPLLVVGLTIVWVQVGLDFYKNLQIQKEIELKFLEFTRNLVGNVKAGVSIPRGIINISDEDYGALSYYVKKLARQIEWGIPIHKALITFANDTNNIVIKRAISIIIEADESGGDIEDILSSVAVSVVNIKKMKEERKSAVYSQILQGYIVFFVFIGIMLVLQLWLFPKLATSLELTNEGEFGLTTLGSVSGIFQKSEERFNLDFTFFMLILIQGFFGGIMVGKFSEGSIKHGLLHSLILMTTAALIITTVKGGI